MNNRGKRLNVGGKSLHFVKVLLMPVSIQLNTIPSTILENVKIEIAHVIRKKAIYVLFNTTAITNAWNYTYIV